MTKIIIVGAGGHGRVVAELAELSGYKDIVFLDSGWPSYTENYGWRIIGTPADLTKVSDDFTHAIAASGDNTVRLAQHETLVSAGLTVPTLVHPTATVSKHTELGAGSMVCAGAILGVYGTTGKSVILNTACSVDHDCSLSDCVHIAPGAHLCGTVTVGMRSFIGVGASVNQNLVIGSDVVVGAGAAVTRNVADGKRVLGVPARIQDAQ